MPKTPRWTEFPRYPVTAGTALLATGVTLASWGNFDVSPLVENAMIRHGEYWRLITSIFPHVGAFHLIFNIYWLWIFGAQVEQVYGHFKTAALFLLFAIGPNALEYAFSAGGVGLSGVGYGLFGLLWVLSKKDERFRESIDNKTIRLFVIWFFICIVTTAANLMNVGNVAHGTGAVLGILAGLAITIPDRRALISATISTVVLFGLWGAAWGRPKVNFSQAAGYDECARGYASLESNRDQDAVGWFGEAVRYRSIPAGCWYDFGVARQRTGNHALALTSYRKAAELGDPSAQFVMGELYDSGQDGLPKDSTQAMYWYGKAASQGSVEALNSVAWALATSPDPAIRNPAAALEYAHKAVNADRDHPQSHVLDTLAEAYYINEKYEDAIATEKQAINLATETEKATYLKSLAKYRLAQGGKRPPPAKS
jgi:membrane associated rhomboid family serine protease/TPR repeat protein